MLTTPGMLLLSVSGYDRKTWREKLFLLLRGRQYRVLWCCSEAQCLESRLHELCRSDRDNYSRIYCNSNRRWSGPAVINSQDYSRRRDWRLSWLRL